MKSIANTNRFKRIPHNKKKVCHSKCTWRGNSPSRSARVHARPNRSPRDRAEGSVSSFPYSSPEGARDSGRTCVLSGRNGPARPSVGGRPQPPRSGSTAQSESLPSLASGRLRLESCTVCTPPHSFERSSHPAKSLRDFAGPVRFADSERTLNYTSCLPAHALLASARQHGGRHAGCVRWTAARLGTGARSRGRLERTRVVSQTRTADANLHPGVAR